MLLEHFRPHHNIKSINAALAGQSKLSEQGGNALPSSLSCCVVLDNSVSFCFSQSSHP